jgi:hypothetical protein
LARSISGHGGTAADKMFRLDHQGGITLAYFATDVAAELIQGVDKVPDRALTHARHAIETIDPFPQGDHCGDESNRRSTIAYEHFGSVDWYRPSLPADEKCGSAVAHLNLDPELRQAIEHGVGVVANQGAGEGRFSSG